MLTKRPFMLLFVLPVFFLMTFGFFSRANAETFNSTIADTRTFVAYKVSATEAAKWLPDGYEIAPRTSGAYAGANLFFVFIDRLLHLDAKDQPKGAGAYRMVAVVVPGKQIESGEKATFIARVYSPTKGAGPYKNSAHSNVKRQVTHTGENAGANAGNDTWVVRHDGGELALKMTYAPAVPKLVKKDSLLTSAADPSIRRVYKYQQLVDVIKSTPNDVDRVSNLSITVTIPELKDMFDGSEQLIGIASIPWYTRFTYVP